LTTQRKAISNHTACILELCATCSRSGWCKQDT